MERFIYGTMGLGGSWEDDKLTDEEIKIGQNAIKAALEVGIDSFDFANIYRRGKSELIFGKYLKYHKIERDTLFLQSKVGIVLPQKGSYGYYDFDADHIISEVEGTLNRLSTTYLDRLILHRFDVLVNEGELSKAIQYLKKEEKILSVGVSNMTPAQISTLEAYMEEEIDGVQMEMSLLQSAFVTNELYINHPPMLHHNFPNGLLHFCHLRGIELQAYSPLAKGKLSGGNISPEEQVKYAAAIEYLQALAHEKGVSKDVLVLSWLLKHPAGIRPVIGTTSPDRIKDLASAREDLLNKEEWYHLLQVTNGIDLP